MIQAGFTLLFFLAAYIGFCFLRFALRRFFKYQELASKIVHSLEKGLFFLCLEIASFASLELFTFEGSSIVKHILVILFILTIGYVLVCVATALHHFGVNKYTTQEPSEITQRSTLTQIHFIYRLGIVVIIILTFAAVAMTFPTIKALGFGLLGSAGIAGIALGIAAKPIILNVMSGLQIAFSKTLRIGDAIVVEGENATVEDIKLTHVIAKTWDFRRVILPTSYFIEHPFQNWSSCSAELLGSVFLYCDYSIPIEVLRKKFEELLRENPYFNGTSYDLHVTSCDATSIEIRLIMTAKDAPSVFQLRAFIREKMIEFIQKEYPTAFPKQRYLNECSQTS